MKNKRIPNSLLISLIILGISAGIIYYFFNYQIISHPSTSLSDYQRENEMKRLKKDFEENRELYDNLISAILKDQHEEENFGGYYDENEQSLITYDYSNKPEKLKSPELNKVYKEYYEKSEIPFEGIDVSFDSSFFVSFEGRANKNNLYNDIYNPLCLVYSKDFDASNWTEEIIELNDDWYAYFHILM